MDVGTNTSQKRKRVSPQHVPARSATRSRFGLVLVFGTALLLFLFVSSNCSAQEIILRDLTRITNNPVKSATNQSLNLSDGQKLSWSSILQARVDSVWQKPVDERIAKFGLPLYRLTHRLKQKNYTGAYEIAQQWYDDEQNSFVGPDANFLVCRSVMFGRIARGENAKAVEAMIRALQLQQQCSSELLNSIPDIAFAEDELVSRLCDELFPVWSSAEEARTQLSNLDSKFDLERLVDKWPGLAVYLSSMAVQSGQRERMLGWNSAMAKVPELRPWQRILNSDHSRTPLANLIRGTEGSMRVTTMYWWAVAEDQQAAKADRVLTLLKIVANYQDQFPSLAKESLARAVELTDDPDEKAALVGR